MHNSESGRQNILRDHIVKGYSIREKRLREQNERLAELQKTVNLMGRAIAGRDLAKSEADGLLRVIADYEYALSILDQYDYGGLRVRRTTRRAPLILTYEAARRAIEELARQSRGKRRTIGLFGIEKDQSLKSSLGTIYQTFDGKDLYPSVEEKAANLLYFVVKNHSFADGNKRIGAFLFLRFLDMNRILYADDGSKRIGDNALVALTLMIAESRPKDRDTIIKVIVNLINKDN